MKKFYKSLPLYVVVAGMLALLAGSAFISSIPANSPGTEPPVGVFLAMGLFAILLTAVILQTALKLGLPLKQSTIGLVFGFNVLIATVKFVVAPLSLYLTNSSVGFVSGDPLVSTWGYWLIAAATFMLYGLVLFTIFKMTANRLSAKQHKKLPIWKFAGGLSLLALVVYFTGSVFVFLVVATIPFAPLVEYLIATGPGLVLILGLLVVAIMTAVKAFQSAADEAKQLRNATLLASLFWLCLSIILLYHVLWVVFMTALVTIWPFKTFIPNSK
jgi:hypothetical protein